MTGHYHDIMPPLSPVPVALLLRCIIITQVPCILLTARGVPDVATRAFLFALTAALPATPSVALVDWCGGQ